MYLPLIHQRGFWHRVDGHSAGLRSRMLCRCCVNVFRFTSNGANSVQSEITKTQSKSATNHGELGVVQLYRLDELFHRCFLFAGLVEEQMMREPSYEDRDG